ncbi:MAG: copper resistance D family protein [Acidiferrobacter sp.]
MSAHAPYIAVSAFDIIALVLVIGPLATTLWVLPKEARNAFQARLWHFTGAALVALTLSSMTLLVGRTLEMSRQGLSKVVHWLPLVLRETPFGRVWLVRPIMLVLAWAAWYIGRNLERRRVAASFLFAAAAVIAFTRSATGHPADQGSWTLPEWVDWIHLVAVSVWAGVVFTMSVVIFPRLPQERVSPSVRADLITRLSSVATVALIGILVTGVLSAYHYVGTWTALRDSSYGHVLLVKLALVAVAVALGAANRFLFVPPIRAAASTPVGRGATTHDLSERSLRLLIRSVRIEALFLLAALAAAAVLLHGMPLREMDHAMGGTMAQSPRADHPARARRVTMRRNDARQPHVQQLISTICYGILSTRPVPPGDLYQPRETSIGASL